MPATTTKPCSCDCHLGPFVLCTLPGGCRAAADCQRQGKTPGSCPSCWWRDPDPSKGDRRVCGPCERWLPILVRSIVDKTADLPDLMLPTDWADDPGGDPVSRALPAGPTPGRRKHPKVRHSRPGSPAPVRLDVLDLLGPVVREGGRPADSLSVDTWAMKLPRVVPGDERELSVRELRMVPVRDINGWIVDEELVERVRTVVIRERQVVRNDRGQVLFATADDQVGHIPVAQVLDQEVRAWLDAGAPGSRWRPVPTVPELGRWLVNRLPWAVQNYGPIDESRITLNRLRGTLMAVLDEFDPEPELCVGVECNRCDKRLLMRRNDGTGDVECSDQNCGSIMTAEDYREWAKRQGAWEASKRDPEQVRELLRPTYRRPADTPVTSG